jgi:hypothetical protein
MVKRACGSSADGGNALLAWSLSFDAHNVLRLIVLKAGIPLAENELAM